MINQRIEMRLPDDTLLIAEATENTDYPSINVYHQDASGDADEVVFAEYNPEKKIGRKLMAAAYQNNDDDTRYFEPLHYVFKPSFKELLELYKDCEENAVFKIKHEDDFLEIVRERDDLLIYRDFSYDNDEIKNHIGHTLVLAVYGSIDGIQNVSLECEDCNEVVYSADRRILLSEIYKISKPRSMFDVISFAKDTEKLQGYGCVGYYEITFGPNGMFHSKWNVKTAALQNERFDNAFNELIYDYLRCNLLENPFDMKKRCEDSENLHEIWDGEYAAQIVSNDYTFFARFIPNDANSKAYIFGYVNEILYTHLEPMKFPAPSNIDCEATVSYVKHLDSYKNPRITYLDEVEDECWELFKVYASYVGVEFGDGIDYTIAKEISEKIMSLVERTFGVDFPLSKGC